MPEEFEPDQDPAVRSFWSGTISFGLVSVPVALYAANRAGGVALRMVSPEGTPLARRYFAPRDDRELNADEIVRGYATEKGGFVLVDDDELERLAPERTRDIDLRQFVQLSEIDPMYFERAYFLTPAGSSTKAYRLLARVMEETGRAGIATFVMRGREYLVAILAENGILRAETLRFADELRTPESVGLPEPTKPDAADVQRMDREIGKRMTRSLPAKELEDPGKDRLMKLVRRKLRAGGKDVVQMEEPAERETDVIDLMEVLKRRLQGESEQGTKAAADDGPATGESPRRTQPAAEKAAARKSSSANSAAGKATAKTATGGKVAAKKTAARRPAAKKAATAKPTAKSPASERRVSKKTASAKAPSRKRATWKAA